MIDLSTLKNTHRKRISAKRVGRGAGSKLGKTCGRGEKGDGSRSGYKRRLGKEGGQLPLYRKLPIRGFTRGRFLQPYVSINLSTISKMFHDGETVSLETLKEKNFYSGQACFLKVLGEGELDKKVTVEASKISASAQAKLEKAGVKVTLV